MNVRIRVGIDKKALPELVSYDEGRVEIAGRPALANAPDNFSTNWQHNRRVFAAAPGAASVRARIRGSGRAAIELAQFEFHPVQVNSYETGMLVDPTYASLRKGVVLESNFGILNEERVSTEDRDGDGRWALITVDLDRLTEPSRRGEHWRSRFEHNPGAICWSDGAVLKFDGWAHLPELDPLFERVAVWTLTDVWEPPAVIRNKGGSPRMGRDPQNISSHLRLMAREFERTGDPVFLAVPRRSILEGFGRDDRSFGTRETGLVFNYLPWFLRALEANGNPQEDPELELKPAQSELSAARGQECAVTFVVANRGATPIEDLAVSCRGRLDFEVVAPADLPRRLEPGATAALTYRVRAPEHLNLTCRANRVAPIHCAALYRREGRRHVASNWIEVVVQDR